MNEKIIMYIYQTIFRQIDMSKVKYLFYKYCISTNTSLYKWARGYLFKTPLGAHEAISPDP